ncbi:MAG: DeoR/GlpR family DNA-binding transcription regulator [Actinomycetota bacterium]|nr:DeoR/GlpR family DNA-binding transcription regulator [Actinomycetota bacterium]
MIENKDDLLIEERRNKIAEWIDKVERVTIEDVIKNFNISRSTTRRDLMDLERKNLIIRTRGGALKKKYFHYEFSLDEKKDLNLNEKKKIAYTAKRFISEGDVVYISGGTTTQELAKLLLDLKNIIVFTNAINILLELVQNKNIEIKLVGGNFRSKTLSLVGQETIEYLQKYNFDKAFVGANGISIEEGITTPNELEAIVDGEVIKRSKECFLLTDDTKFGTIAFSKICELNDIDYIVTNKDLNSNLFKKIKQKGVKIISK